MRLMMWLGPLLLLSGCATSTANYYTQTVSGWRGGNAKNLVSHWGQPDQKVISPSGSTTYVYHTQSYRTYHYPTSPPVAANYSEGGRPVIVPMTNTTLNNEDRRFMSIPCTVIFETNSKGVVTRTKVQGSGCYGSDRFARRKKNQRAH